MRKEGFGPALRVKGVDYPIARAEILSAAREAGVGPTVQEALRKELNAAA